jgi:hypothetical protein
VRPGRISSAVEQRFCKPKVGGSIPSSGTIPIPAPQNDRPASTQDIAMDDRTRLKIALILMGGAMAISTAVILYAVVTSLF